LGPKLSFSTKKFHPVFPFAWAPSLLLHIFFSPHNLYNYYHYSQTLCIKCISYPDLINQNFLTLQIPLKEGIGDETEGEF
jgi:hypothetical protein